MENSLQILDAREQDLIKLANDFKGLKISGIDDREGFLKVSEARKSIKVERVQIEKDAKQLREGAIKFQKTVITREKELISIIEPTENELYEQEEKYKKLKAEQEREKEKQAIQKTQDRVNSLAKFGKAMDYFELKHLTDERFNEILTQAEIDFNAEQEKIAHEKAEAERLRNEEAARLKVEREELARQRAEIEAAQRKADLELAERSRKEREELDRIRKEQEARERELQRQEQERIAAEKKRQEESKAEADRIRKEREQLDREKRQHEEQMRLEQAKKESAERARIEEQERVKREEQEKIEHERIAKLEAERQEALKPDKDKLMQYAHNLMSVSFPELVHDDAKKISDGLKEKVLQVVVQIQKTANGL